MKESRAQFFDTQSMLKWAWGQLLQNPSIITREVYNDFLTMSYIENEGIEYTKRVH